MTHGPQAVADLVNGAELSYPISKTRLEREFALENVSIDKRGNSVMLGELLSDVEANRFQDENDLLNGFEPTFEAEREHRSVGTLTRLKRLFLGIR